MQLKYKSKKGKFRQHLGLGEKRFISSLVSSFLSSVAKHFLCQSSVFFKNQANKEQKITKTKTKIGLAFCVRFNFADSGGWSICEKKSFPRDCYFQFSFSFLLLLR
jgi:hypothetical protein